MADSTTVTLAKVVGRALRPLQPALASRDAFRAMAARLGWRLADIPAPIQGIAGGVDRLVTALEPFYGDQQSAAEIGELVSALRVTVDEIGALSTASFDAQLLADGFATQFPARLIEFLIAEYVVVHHPTIAFAAKTLGVIRESYVAKSATRPAYLRRELAWPAIAELISDPAMMLENAYGWRTQQFDSQELLGTLAALLTSLKLNVVLESMRRKFACLRS